VSRAKIPTKPSSPVLALNVALGLMLGLGGGIGAIVVREALDTGVTTAEELEAALAMPYLAGIPSLASTVDGADAETLNPAEYVVDKPLSTFAEAFRALRASLQLSRLGAQVKVIAITSSMPDEGKTTTSVCLARVMAMAGDRVILIDCDLRKRAVSRAIGGDEPTAGLVEVLAGTVPLEKAVRVDARTGAHYLPLAESAYTPKDVFGTVAMDQLLETLRGKYDVVVLDTAPVLPVADTRVIAAKADVVTMLVRWRKTPRKATAAGIKLLQAGDTYIAGGALTQINMKEQARYGYGDPGYYYRSYRKYYGE
jgi:capsular exopolysaccharide synthesis family protein